MDEIFLGVMDINEARTHQLRLKALGVAIEFKTNGHTCTTGCKVTVELWGKSQDEEKIKSYFQDDYQKHVRGHNVDHEQLSGVYDQNSETTICQACGTSFSTSSNECPDCGLVYA